MHARWLAAATFLFGLTLQAVSPVTSTSPTAPAETAYFKTGILTLQDRIWAQRRIERVWYNHRIWPKENPGQKPPFETMVPAAVIEAKVTDSLKKSAALDKYWRHPVTGEMLQAELDRMAKQTRDPATLKELFEALRNDPRLIAETLARETLSDRIIRNWYSSDARLHVKANPQSRGSDFDHWWQTAAAVIPISDAATAAASASTPVLLPGLTPVAGCDAWQDRLLIDGSPAARSFFTTVWTGTEMIVWGGSGPGGYTNTGGRYNPATDIWSTMSTGTDLPAARRAHSAVWTGSEMIVWGGRNASGHLNSGGRYSPAADTWRPTSAGVNSPAARRFHNAIWTGSEMIVWGGTDGVSYLNTGGRYSPSTDLWAQMSAGANAPTPRAFSSAVWTGSLMIVWGGDDFNGTLLNTGGRYNPQNDSWQPTDITSPALPAERDANSAVWTGTEMIVWGGSDINFIPFNNGGRYNPVTDSWLALSTAAGSPGARQDHSAIWTGSEMILWGGVDYSGAGVYFNDGFRYSPVANRWTPVNQSGGNPPPSSEHGAVWTGTEMLVWGGRSSTGTITTGGRYAPASDSWLPIPSTPNVPSARYVHSAVWTGSEMIIWGGYWNVQGQDVIYNDGGRYNPVTHSWLPTSTSGAVPTPRRQHAAAWTGTEMIVWGGNDITASFNNGGRYNPLTNTWAAISPMAGITTSPGAGAIWTGSELLLWSGDAQSSSAKFNPSTNGWAQISAGANSPASRGEWGSAWTGTEMIIWGGMTDGFTATNSGARYSPSADSWRPMTVGAFTPSARRRPLVFWSGRDLIVWGGMDASFNALNTGSRYSLNSETWTPMSMDANVPIPAAFSNAVWTGEEMITWGGDIPGTITNAGARYRAASDSWLKTAIDPNTASPRDSYSAVWTGSAMLVWGGAFNDNTGGIYISGSAPSPGNSLRGGKTSFINLSWSNIYGAGSYNVKRCNPTTSSCIPGAIISTPTINQYSEPDDGFSHFYTVEAVNQCGATP